jgi:hypothetical protein
MALPIPRTGLATMLKDGARHFHGLEEAVYRNINACKELSVVTRSAYGPNGEFGAAAPLSAELKKLTCPEKGLV